MSWKPEMIADSTGKWIDNALRFHTCKEAQDYAQHLANRWALVQNYRATSSRDPVNHRYLDDALIPVDSAEDPLR